jgi:hypothetical protein
MSGLGAILTAAGVAGAIGAMSFQSCTPELGPPCEDRTVVYYKAPLGCVPQSGDVIVRLVPPEFTLLDALNFALEIGGGQVINHGGAIAVQQVIA